MAISPDPDPARRSRLLALKLAALVRDHVGDEGIEVGELPGFAALIRDGEAWVLADARPERALGPALAWARRRSANRLHIVADDGTGILARRAALLSADIDVWQVDGRSLRPAIAAPYPAKSAIVDRLLTLLPLIEAGGATPVIEHGVLVGEVCGLEVCRALIDPFTDEARLEVGVGAHDREAFSLLHGSIPTEQALAGVVRSVAEHRRPGADPHPLNRLGAERLLRHRLIEHPGLIGAASLTVAEPPVVRENVKDPVPCVAAGSTEGGEPLIVVCSTGVDLDLIPFAVDARGAVGAADHVLRIVVPVRDRYPVTEALAGLVAGPTELIGVSV